MGSRVNIFSLGSLGNSVWEFKQIISLSRLQFPLLSNRQILSFLYEGPGDSDGKEYTCRAGDLGSIPGSGRSPEEGNGNPLQYSCLEDAMDRGLGRATVQGVAKSWT